ncbi:MAG: hypothetical protein IPM12_04560 [Flavobacteriales bacterium]|nr:hypothetical protein [Flavobacteriales bacterium]
MGVLAGASTRCAAQATGAEVVYRFEVSDVIDQASAKPIVHALMAEREVASCVFISECTCFKLTARHTLDRAALSVMLQRAGHALSGTVHGSDGSVLPPSTSPLR